MTETPEQAFEWVAQEIELRSAQERAALCAAWMASRNDGWSSATRRAFEAAWPGDARWPSGEEYLRTLGWRSPDELPDDEAWDAYVDEYDGPELMELLHQRLLHVAYRMVRDAQVRGMLDARSPQRVPAYTHALLNQDGDFRGDPCGLGVDKVISIEEALTLMAQPAHAHPACCCTVGPFVPITSADRARLRAA